jgi:DNA mismatch repair ATPase MutL
MKVKHIVGATALSLILAGAAYPQQEQEKEKPQQQEQKPEQKPAEQPKRQPAEQPKTQQRQEQQSTNKQQQQEQKNEQKNEQKQEKQSARQQSEQEKQPEQGNRERQDVTKQQRTDERDQHSDQGHGRIPDDRFRASFGREHHFRVGHFDNRRFQFGGYWFSFNEGWPVGWAYTDDFYIDFIDGQYYLIDLSHPGVQLLLVVD